ncbi:MAG: hypothetical protein AABZ15_14475 [Nitrospirota bacterium]
MLSDQWRSMLPVSTCRPRYDDGPEGREREDRQVRPSRNCNVTTA